METNTKWPWKKRKRRPRCLGWTQNYQRYLAKLNSGLLCWPLWHRADYDMQYSTFPFISAPLALRRKQYPGVGTPREKGLQDRHCWVYYFLIKMMLAASFKIRAKDLTDTLTGRQIYCCVAKGVRQSVTKAYRQALQKTNVFEINNRKNRD